MNHPTPLDIRPLTPALGAEVFGIDLSAPLSPFDVEAIRRALVAHQVIFFRDQHMSHEQHIQLGQRFGSLHVHPLAAGNHPDHPELLRIHADETSERVAGENWHTDVSCEEEPPMGSMLYLKEVPASGGDTMFCSMYAAYDALSRPMQQFLEGLSAVHDGAKVWTRYGMTPSRPFARTEHPIVAVHPDTGRKLLFVNKVFTSHIPALSAKESDALLDMLYRHIENPRFMCRFRWQPNSVAFWDNRCTQHQAIFDYFPARRSGYRVTINGTRPLAAVQADVSRKHQALAVAA
jgi:taurine dioxygenase